MAKSKGYVWRLILIELKLILILLLRSKSSNNRKKAPRYENIESSSGSEVEFDSNEPFKDDEMESFNKESDKVLLNKINSKKVMIQQVTKKFYHLMMPMMMMTTMKMIN
jgi:hypothetical protein